MAQFYPQIGGNFLLLGTFLLQHFQLDFGLFQTDFLVLFGCIYASYFAFHKVQVTAFQEIFIHLIPFHPLLQALMQFLNLFQLFHPLFHIIQGALHILIGAHIFPENLNINLFFIQHIGVNKVLDIINRLKCKSFRNQTEELVFDSSKPCCDHFSRFHIGLAPLANVNVGASEFCNGFHLISVKKQVIGKSGVLHQITDGRFLPLRSRIYHRADNEILILAFLIKFQRNMGTDLPGALIRLILFSGFAADIAGQLSLAVFVGGLVEIPGGTDDHELDCIQKSGFSSAVFTGQKSGISKIYGTVVEPVPVNQLHPRQFLHCLCSFPFCMFPVSQMQL